MRNKSFRPEYIYYSDDLERIVRDGIEKKDTHYYLILNDWDKDSLRMHSYLAKMLMDMYGDTTLNVVSIFDIPNAAQVIKSALVESKGEDFISDLDFMNKIPALITIIGNYVKSTDYPGAFYKELGI